jgi:hypothetical protein
VATTTTKKKKNVAVPLSEFLGDSVKADNLPSAPLPKECVRARLAFTA